MSEIKHSHYSYKHHIIPKHEWKRRFGNLEGFNAPDNVARLTIEQHADAHRWLWEEYGSENDKLAWQMMVGQIGKEELQRELARINGKKNKGSKRSESIKKKMSVAVLGVNNPFYRKSHTTEMLQFFSESQQGDKSYNYGKPKSEETKRLMSIAAKGKPKTPEHRAAISLARRRQVRKKDD
jgi:NUMOD3 motif